MLTLPKALWRELGGPARSHGRRGAAEAAPEAAAEPRESRRGSRGEASPQPVRSRVAIVRCVWSASTTSRVAPLLEAIVVVGETVTPSRLQLHLVLVSRIDLLLRKGQEART